MEVKDHNQDNNLVGIKPILHSICVDEDVLDREDEVMCEGAALHMVAKTTGAHNALNEPKDREDAVEAGAEAVEHLVKQL